MKRFPYLRAAVRKVMHGLVGLGVALACAGCQTTVEEYTPPIPVDPHRAQTDGDLKPDDDAARAARHSIESHGVAFSAKPRVGSVQLETRGFQLGPESRIHVPTLEGEAEGSREFLMEYFATAGVNVKRPNRFEFDAREGHLEVRATAEELDIIAAVLQDLVRPVPQQIAIEGLIVETSPVVTKELGLDWFRDSVSARIGGDLSPPRRGNPYQFTTALTTSQVDVIARAMGANPGVRVMPIQPVTTLSGRHTQFSQVLPDESHVEIDCLPVVERNGYSIVLTMRMRAGRTGGLSAGRVGSVGQPVRAPLEYVGDRAVYDGQTFVFGGDFPELPPSPAEIESTELDRSLLVILTPTIVDADGNRVHPLDRLPYDPNSIPPQNYRR